MSCFTADPHVYPWYDAGAFWGSTTYGLATNTVGGGDFIAYVIDPISLSATWGDTLSATYPYVASSSAVPVCSINASQWLEVVSDFSNVYLALLNRSGVALAHSSSPLLIGGGVTSTRGHRLDDTHVAVLFSFGVRTYSVSGSTLTQTSSVVPTGYTGGEVPLQMLDSTHLLVSEGTGSTACFVYTIDPDAGVTAVTSVTLPTMNDGFVASYKGGKDPSPYAVFGTSAIGEDRHLIVGHWNGSDLDFGSTYDANTTNAVTILGFDDSLYILYGVAESGPAVHSAGSLDRAGTTLSARCAYSSLPTSLSGPTGVHGNVLTFQYTAGATLGVDAGTKLGRFGGSPGWFLETIGMSS